MALTSWIIYSLNSSRGWGWYLNFFLHISPKKQNPSHSTSPLREDVWKTFFSKHEFQAEWAVAPSYCNSSTSSSTISPILGCRKCFNISNIMFRIQGHGHTFLIKKYSPSTLNCGTAHCTVSLRGCSGLSSISQGYFHNSSRNFAY